MTTPATRVRHTARRLRQSVDVFDNGWAVLWAAATRADEVVYRRGDLAIHAPNVPGARVPVYEVFAEDEYDLTWFGRGLGPAPVVVDIGAHIGCFSIDLARRHPGARITCFEPTPSTGGYLERNVAANGLADRIDVHRTALSARAGVLTMADNGPGSGHNGVLHLGEPGTTEIQVDCESIVDVLAAVGGEVDLLKMDAEGAEYDIVLDSPREVWAGVRRLVMEYHPSTVHSLDDLAAALAEAGLLLRRRDEGGSDIGLAWFSREEIPAA